MSLELIPPPHGLGMRLAPDGLGMRPTLRFVAHTGDHEHALFLRRGIGGVAPHAAVLGKTRA